MNNMYQSISDANTEEIEPLDRDFSVEFDPNFLLQKATKQPLAIDDSNNGSSPKAEEAARLHNSIGPHQLFEHAQASPMITNVTRRGGKSRRKDDDDNNNNNNNNNNNMRSKKPRSQAAHTMSERRRRENIRSKMKAMRQLLPHCDKTRDVEVLDRAIEYIEELQAHIQIQETTLCKNLQGNMLTDDNQHISTSGVWPHGFQMVPSLSSFSGSVHPSLLANTGLPEVPGIVPQVDQQVPIAHPFVVPGCFWGMYGGVHKSDQSGSSLNPSQASPGGE